VKQHCGEHSAGRGTGWHSNSIAVSVRDDFSHLSLHVAVASSAAAAAAAGTRHHHAYIEGKGKGKGGPYSEGA